MSEHVALRVDQVNSKETFLEFIDALRKDWELSQEEEQVKPSSPWGSAARGWENPEVGEFLEAMSAWTKDMGDKLPTDPTWGTFAQMLYSAKQYE